MIQRFSLLVTLSLAASGCLDTKLCASDSDCEGTGFCQDGICVFDPADSGASGGGGGSISTGGGGGSAITGGGGGAETGGGSAGGGGSGGGGGGGTVTCDAQCTGPERECVDNLCVNAFTIELKEPADNDVYNLSTPIIVFGASVIRIDGGNSGLSQLPFTIPGFPGVAPLIGDGGSSFSAVYMLPNVEQNYLATAGWNPGPRAQARFRVDRVRPGITIELPPTPDGGFLRDARIPAVLRSTEPLDEMSVGVTINGTQQDLTTVRLDCTSRFQLGPNDVCLQLDFASPTFNVLSGPVTIAAAANDLAGNAAPTASTQALVTRVRWTKTFATGRYLSAPALDRNGNVYIGSELTTATGQIQSFTPAGAARAGFPIATGSVQSVSIVETAVTNTTGGELVLAAMNTSLSAAAALRAYSTDGGVPFGTVATQCSSLTNNTWSAITVFDGGINATGNMVAHAAIVFSRNVSTNTDGRFCVQSALGGTAEIEDPAFEQSIPQSPGHPRSPTNLVSIGSTVYFQSGNGVIRPIQASPVVSVMTPSSAVNSTSNTGLSIAGSVLFSAMTRNAGTPLAAFTLPSPTSATIEPMANTPWGASAYAPVFVRSNANGGVALTPNISTGLLNWVLSTSVAFDVPSFSSTTVVSGPSTATSLLTSPVVGTGLPGNGPRVYAVMADGTLHVFNASTTSGLAGVTAAWSATTPFGSLAEVRAHPTLDCSRTGLDRPGTLYVVGQVVASTGGFAAAIIVDSTKLDPQSPWPKWQRTAGNSGNPAFPLNPGCP